MNIGVFDSGVGGLTVVQALQKVLKGINLYYLADTKHAPYGEKTPREILEYSIQITEYLLHTHHIEVLILACNTATAFAIESLRERYPFLIIIGTEPGLKPASLHTFTKNIAVLATSATLESEKYQTLVSVLSSKNNIAFFSQACHGLVEQIEKGCMYSKTTKAMLEQWLIPMQKNDIDTIVLGCTHYPLITQLIYEIMGKDIKVIETSTAIAKYLLIVLMQEKGHINEGNLSIIVESTGKINTALVETMLKTSIIVKKVIIF